jgi:type IV secretory pathway VirB3-like protein
MFSTLIFPSWDKARFSIIRSLLWIWLVIYSIQFFTPGINPVVMNAWIHGPNLIFHEAGHIIFMPFGEFMMILGGSLMQCLVPAVLVWVFVLNERDPYAASLTLWWLGQNLTDVALYISDASARSLPLIGGMSEDAHDWGNILTMLDLLQYDHLFGTLMHILGVITMLIALLWWLATIGYTYVNQNPERA